MLARMVDPGCRAKSFLADCVAAVRSADQVDRFAAGQQQIHAQGQVGAQLGIDFRIDFQDQHEPPIAATPQSYSPRARIIQFQLREQRDQVGMRQVTIGDRFDAAAFAWQSPASRGSASAASCAGSARFRPRARPAAVSSRSACRADAPDAKTGRPAHPASRAAAPHSQCAASDSPSKRRDQNAGSVAPCDLQKPPAMSSRARMSPRRCRR